MNDIETQLRNAVTEALTKAGLDATSGSGQLVAIITDSIPATAAELEKVITIKGYEVLEEGTPDNSGEEGEITDVSITPEKSKTCRKCGKTEGRELGYERLLTFLPTTDYFKRTLPVCSIHAAIFTPSFITLL